MIIMGYVQGNNTFSNAIHGNSKNVKYELYIIRVSVSVAFCDNAIFVKNFG